VVDFNKHCGKGTMELFPPAGVAISYHRCGRCGFIFTIAFDDFAPADFMAHIYNEGYAALDPDYAGDRPTTNAWNIAQLFGANRALGILDYGSGSGILAERLRTAGFGDVVAYDPYVPRFSQRPLRKFDLVVSFEVVEHSNQPRETFADMDSFLEPGGAMFFSTLLQPPDIARLGMNWWYVAPRNGHVSLFTQAALACVLGPRGFTVGSYTDNLHVAWRKKPSWVIDRPYAVASATAMG
jgi:2-polyprenyl-6-hydroxyphenyl methylase/3-demethylubiquinone-9 3-methyltransferase